MESHDVNRFVAACHLFADSVACFNETMAMTAENAASVEAGKRPPYDQEQIESLLLKYSLGINDVIARLNT